MRELVAIAVLGLAGCAPPAYDREIISGTADTVSVKAGIYANPGPLAVEHCAGFGKNAVLRVASGDIYIFDCVPKPQ